MHLLACQVRVTAGRFRSLLFSSCDVFQALIISLDVLVEPRIVNCTVFDGTTNEAGSNWSKSVTEEARRNAPPQKKRKKKGKKTSGESMPTLNDLKNDSFNKIRLLIISRSLVRNKCVLTRRGSLGFVINTNKRADTKRMDEQAFGDGQ